MHGLLSLVVAIVVLPVATRSTFLRDMTPFIPLIKDVFINIDVPVLIPIPTLRSRVRASGLLWTGSGSPVRRAFERPIAFSLRSSASQSQLPRFVFEGMGPLSPLLEASQRRQGGISQTVLHGSRFPSIDATQMLHRMRKSGIM